jgi:hypothetical protein
MARKISDMEPEIYEKTCIAGLSSINFVFNLLPST